MAIAAGRRLADRLFGNMPKAKANYDMVPTVLLSYDPQCIYRFSFDNNPPPSWLLLLLVHTSPYLLAPPPPLFLFIPSYYKVIFSHPTIGTVGLTEEEAEAVCSAYFYPISYIL